MNWLAVVVQVLALVTAVIVLIRVGREARAAARAVREIPPKLEELHVAVNGGLKATRIELADAKAEIVALKTRLLQEPWPHPGNDRGPDD